MKKLVIAGLLGLAAAGAIAQSTQGLPPGIAKKMSWQAQVQKCDDCGTVQDVKHEKRKGEGGAVGIVAGAATGGLIGNQFGKGDGRTLATVGGAVAGGFVGNEVQKRVATKDVWVTRVKMKDGSVRTFEHDKQPTWKAGALVKVNGKAVSAYAAS